MDMTKEHDIRSDAAASVYPGKGLESSATVEEVDRAAGATVEKVEAAAEMIRVRQDGPMGSTTTAVADEYEEVGSYLSEQGPFGILEDVEALIRRYPLQSLLVGVGVGYLMAKLKR